MELGELKDYTPPSPPQLLGSFDESEDSTSAISTNLTHNFRTTQLIKIYSNLHISLGRSHLCFETMTFLSVAY